MAVPRKHALEVIEGLSVRVEEHIAKMAAEPFSLDYNHWRSEVNAWITRIEGLARHVGRRTSKEVLNRVTQWKQAVGQANGRAARG